MLFKIIKILLAILLCIGLSKMPFSYYQLLRFIALIGFSILAYNANDTNNKIELVIYISLALLFQPFIKIILGKSVWHYIDIIVSFYLVISIFIKRNK